jgi:hypothetical protein
MKSEIITHFTPIIQGMQKALHDHPLLDEIKVEISWRYLRCNLSEIRLGYEGENDYKSFFYNERQIYSEREIDTSGAKWARLSTEARLDLIEKADDLFTALTGLPISISFRKSWRWDHQCLRPNGRPTHNDVFEFFIVESSKPFDPKEILESIKDCVCAAKDPRADLYPFSLQDEKGVRLFNSFSTTSYGFLIDATSQENAKAVAKDLYPDCHCEIEEGNMRKDIPWKVKVAFPE